MEVVGILGIADKACLLYDLLLYNVYPLAGWVAKWTEVSRLGMYIYTSAMK